MSRDIPVPSPTGLGSSPLPPDTPFAPLTPSPDTDPPATPRSPFPDTAPPPLSVSHLFTDIWSQSPPSSPSPSPSHQAHQPRPPSLPSEIPRLRSTHITAGYRDGISASKTTSLQPGFDEGYALGAAIGLRVGYILGLLEGVTAALRDCGREMEGEFEASRALLEEARGELVVERVYGRELWGGDGVWKYEVGGEKGEGEGKMTFEDVADAHPLVRKWGEKVEEVRVRWGVAREGFEEEREDGSQT